MKNAPLLRLARVVHTFLAMSSWRLERLSVGWVLRNLASISVAWLVVRVDDVGLTIAYAALTACAYYGGNTILLATRAREHMIARHGADAAWLRYERILALMFLNQGLGLGALGSLSMGRFAASPGIVALGASLLVVGVVTKVWSAVEIGVDVYFYKDMFLGRRLGELVVGGPYRFIPHPIYTVGQLHAYGYALLQRSIPGLVGAVACHLGLLAFHRLAEGPFLARGDVRDPSPLDLATVSRAEARASYTALDEFVFVEQAFAREELAPLVDEAERLAERATRKVVPGYKRSGSVSYFQILDEAPAIDAFYRSKELIAWLSEVAGAALLPCPTSDPHACALYYYTRPGDHIGFHYDASHYRGARYTALVALVDGSSSRLLCQPFKKHRKDASEARVATVPGSLAFFNGDNLWHAISPLGEGERRVVLSLEYVTDPEMGRLRRSLSNMKDAMTYFGFRQLFARRTHAR